MLAFLLSMQAGTEKVLVDTQVFRPYILIEAGGLSIMES